MLKSSKTQVSYEFDKHPNYHVTDAQGRKTPYLDGVNVTFFADLQTMRIARQGADFGHAP